MRCHWLLTRYKINALQVCVLSNSHYVSISCTPDPRMFLVKPHSSCLLEVSIWPRLSPLLPSPMALQRSLYSCLLCIDFSQHLESSQSFLTCAPPLCPWFLGRSKYSSSVLPNLPPAFLGSSLCLIKSKQPLLVSAYQQIINTQ